MGTWLLGTVLATSAPAPSTSTTTATAHVASFGDDASSVELRQAIAVELGARGIEVVSSPDELETSFVVEGELAEGPAGARIHIVVRERGRERPLADLKALRGDGELLLPLVLPERVARAIGERLEPPPPPTDEELEILARLDEDPVLPYEPDPCVVGCCYPAGPEWPGPEEPRYVDLRQDFEDFCRVAPRRRRRGEPFDARPACIRGPVLGYVRPRSWISGSATVVAAAATGLSFGLRASGWDAGGLQLRGHRIGAPLITWGTTSAVLTGALLSTTIVLLVADRRAAKRYILWEKRKRW